MATCTATMLSKLHTHSPFTWLDRQIDKLLQHKHENFKVNFVFVHMLFNKMAFLL